MSLGVLCSALILFLSVHNPLKLFQAHAHIFGLLAHSPTTNLVENPKYENHPYNQETEKQRLQKETRTWIENIMCCILVVIRGFDVVHLQLFACFDDWSVVADEVLQVFVITVVPDQHSIT